MIMVFYRREITLLLLLSAAWLCMVAFNAFRIASFWEEEGQKSVHLVPPVSSALENKHLRSASSSSSLTTITTAPVATPKKPIIPVNDHPICIDNTPDAIRVAGESWHIDSANADVSMYPLGAGTLGIQITSHTPQSPKTMKACAGRLALQQQQSERLLELRKKSPYQASMLHPISKVHDEHSEPDYDEYLGCDNENQTPKGVAVIVGEAFHGHKQRNLWHTIANHHGIWLLLQVLQIPPTKVTAILPSKFGMPFNTSPQFVSDVLWPMHISTNNATTLTTSMQMNCFEKVVFMETTSSPYWSLRFIRERCPEESPYIKMHRQFHDEAREAAMSVIDRLGETNENGVTTDGSSYIRVQHTQNGTQQLMQHQRPKVCYMSRRLEPKRKRHFSQNFETYLHRNLDTWAAQHNNTFEFHTLEFDESTPFSKQVHQSSSCSVLFGPHGAGLAHMLWMQSHSYIIEIGNPVTCETYYRSMAYWYGHTYKCFSEVEGHNVRHDKRTEVYHALNVTLLLDVLDDSVASVIESSSSWT